MDIKSILQISVLKKQNNYGIKWENRQNTYDKMTTDLLNILKAVGKELNQDSSKKKMRAKQIIVLEIRKNFKIAPMKGYF